MCNTDFCASVLTHLWPHQRSGSRGQGCQDQGSARCSPDPISPARHAPPASRGETSQSPVAREKALFPEMEAPKNNAGGLLFTYVAHVSHDSARSGGGGSANRRSLPPPMEGLPVWKGHTKLELVEPQRADQCSSAMHFPPRVRWTRQVNNADR